MGDDVPEIQVRASARMLLSGGAADATPDAVIGWFDCARARGKALAAKGCRAPVGNLSGEVTARCGGDDAGDPGG